MDDAVKKEAVSYLCRHLYANLATISADNRQQPHASTVAYVSDGLCLYFATGAKTEKVRNITANARVSLTVDHDEPDWSKITGLQIEGEAEVLAPDKAAHIVQRYLEKFPYAKTLPPSPDARFVKVVPKKVWLIDYRKAFGHRDYFEVKAEDVPGAKAA